VTGRKQQAATKSMERKRGNVDEALVRCKKEFYKNFKAKF
jgi:hypothetical protein